MICASASTNYKIVTANRTSPAKTAITTAMVKIKAGTIATFIVADCRKKREPLSMSKEGAQVQTQMAEGMQETEEESSFRSPFKKVSPTVVRRHQSWYRETRLLHKPMG